MEGAGQSSGQIVISRITGHLTYQDFTRPVSASVKVFIATYNGDIRHDPYDAQASLLAVGATL
jgi:hypothetical protein